jgi:hypothetical protein
MRRLGREDLVGTAKMNRNPGTGGMTTLPDFPLADPCMVGSDRCRHGGEAAGEVVMASDSDESGMAATEASAAWKMDETPAAGM